MPIEPRRLPHTRAFFLIVILLLLGVALIFAHRLLYPDLMEETIRHNERQALFFKDLVALELSPETRAAAIAAARRNGIRVSLASPAGDLLPDTGHTSRPDALRIQEFKGIKEDGLATVVHSSNGDTPDTVVTVIRLSGGGSLLVGTVFAEVKEKMDSHFTLLLCLVGTALAVAVMISVPVSFRRRRGLERLKHFSGEGAPEGLAAPQRTPPPAYAHAVDPNDCAATAVRLIRNREGCANRIILHPSSAPLEAVGEGPLLVQALNCLLENACRQAPPGSVIRVTVAPHAGSCSISINREGTAMPNVKDFARVRESLERFGGSISVENRGKEGVACSVLLRLIP